MVYAAGVSVSYDLNEHHRNQILKTDAFNLLAPGMEFKIFNFQANLKDWGLRYLLCNCPHMNVTKPHWWQVNIG